MTMEWWMLLAGILAIGWSFWLEKRAKQSQKDELLVIMTRVEQAKSDVALLLTEVEEAAEKLVSKLEQITERTASQRDSGAGKTREKGKKPAVSKDSRFKNKNEILALWAAGHSVDEIAARLGIGKGEAQLIVDLFGKEAGS